LCALTLLGACGGGQPAVDAAAQSCGQEIPASCQMPVPSYATEVAPLIAKHCGGCHGPGGIEQMMALGSYGGLYPRRGTLLVQLYTCRMPPADAGVLPVDEGAIILHWLVCGAPNN
jgi:hypothetical protein